MRQLTNINGERKVYCKNCKFESSPGRSVTRRYYCSRDEKLNPYTGYIIGVENDFDINNKGNCPYYQRCWWKFWVK